MSNKPEQELAARLIRLLKEQQAREGVAADFFQEVRLPDGTCPDLVIHRTDIPDHQDFTCIYQMKMVLNETLLKQCIASQQWADVVIAAVPGIELTGAWVRRASIVKACEDAGIGICGVGKHAIFNKLPARVIPGHVEILKHLNAHNGEGGTFAKSGSKSDRRATKENIIAQQVEKYVAENPGCRFVDVRRAVPGLSRAWGNFERMARLSVYRVRIETNCAPAKVYPLMEASNV